MVIVISFNCSTVNKGLYLQNEPQQITPSHMGVPSWTGLNLPYTLYHVPFSFQPFDPSKISQTMQAIGRMNNFMLGNKISNICIHLSGHKLQRQVIKDSIQRCLTAFDEKIILHFEIIPPYKCSGKIKADALEEADIILQDFASNPRVKYILDTAHAYAYGMSVSEMSNLVLKMSDKIDYIHFNGNQKPPFQPDAHARFFDYSLNRISGLENFLFNLSSNAKKDYVLICEVTNACGPAVPYDVWKQKTECYRNCRIVDYNNSLTL